MASRRRSAADEFPETSAWDRPGFLLWHAVLRWQRAATTALAPLELTHSQFRLLAAVVWLATDLGRPASQREVAEHTGTDAMVTSQVVRALEAKGWLERLADDRDARVWRLRATAEGRRRAVAAVGLVRALDDEFFGPAAGRAEVVALLRHLAGRDAEGGSSAGEDPASA
jgi:DNA-binding MarR family transcriptional regulator